MKRYLDPAIVARLGNLEIIARLVVEGAISGRHKSRFHGFNVEFSEHRPYLPGDDLRHLDWTYYAKSEKLYVKLYEESTSLKAYVLLDASNSMRYTGAAGISKLDYGKLLTAALAYLTLHQRDAMGLGTFSSSLKTLVSPRSHPSQLHRILGTLEATEPGEDTDLFSIFQEFSGHTRRRALVIVVSDFLDDPERLIQGVKFLHYLKHEVILLHVLAREEVDFPFDDYSQFVDLETSASMYIDPHLVRDRYREQMARFIDRFSRECRFHGIDHALFHTDQPFDVSLSRFLALRSRRRR